MLVAATLGDAYFVRVRMPSFQEAIARTVRPAEATPIARVLVRHSLKTGLPCADVLGQWFRSMRALGLLRYIPDPAGPYDFWCSPKTTLKRRGGDCDDLSVLAVSSILRCGWPARIVLGNHGVQGHAWVEGVDEAGWFLFEATNGNVARYRPDAYQPWPEFLP